MSFEQEGSPQEIQERVSRLSDEFFARQKDLEGVAANSTGFVEQMDAYIEAVHNGNFSGPVRFVMERGSEEIQRDGESVRDYLSGALRKYEHYAGDKSPLPEQRDVYLERAELVKQLLHDIEQLSGNQ